MRINRENLIALANTYNRKTLAGIEAPTVLGERVSHIKQSFVFVKHRLGHIEGVVALSSINLVLGSVNSQLDEYRNC